MRGQPFVIRAVPGKASSQLIINATPYHLLQTKQSLVQGSLLLRKIIVMEQELNGKGLGEFGRPAKTTLPPVSHPHQIIIYLLQRLTLEKVHIRLDLPLSSK